MIRLGHIFCCTLLALSALVAAQDSPSALLQQLALARASWERSGVVNYQYGYNKFCECHAETPPETLVSIERGVVTDVRHRMVKTGDVVAAATTNFALYWTVEDLFALLERAAESAATVQAEFDPQSGVPQRIFIDYLPDIIGDEVDVRVTQFNAD